MNITTTFVTLFYISYIKNKFREKYSTLNEIQGSSYHKNKHLS